MLMLDLKKVCEIDERLLLYWHCFLSLNSDSIHIISTKEYLEQLKKFRDKKELEKIIKQFEWYIKDEKLYNEIRTK